MILLMCYKIAGHKNDVHVGLVFTRLQKECRRVKLSSSMLSVLHFTLRTTVHAKIKCPKGNIR